MVDPTKPVNTEVPKEEEEEKVQKTYLDEATGEQVSKGELKKRQKKRENDAKKAAKDAEKAAAAALKPKKEEKPKEELDPSKYNENRKNAL